MADEQRPSEEQSGPLEADPGLAPAPEPDAGASGTQADAGDAPAGSWGGALIGLALLAVLLTIAGFFGQIQKVPNHLPLGLGLFLWGVLDLAAQRRGLVQWKGAKRVVGNTVNLLRGLALIGVGVWLCLMAAGMLRPVGTAVVSNVGVLLLAAYLGTALVLEITVKGVRLSAQAFLLLALACALISYLYFSIPFTFAWAAVFTGLAFASAAWSIYARVLEETPALSRAVLAAVLLLSAPITVFTVQQMFFTAEQPLFTPTLLIPRMRQVIGDLGEDAGQIKWAPVHTQSSQPGDVPFSDKLAFTDWLDDKPGVGLFVQQDDGKGEYSWLDTGEDARLTGFSEDGRVLALSQVKPGAQEPSLAVLEPADPAQRLARKMLAQAAAEAASVGSKEPKDKHAKAREAKAAAEAAALESPWVLRTLYSSSVEPGPSHGQVWRGQGKELYFAAPLDGLRQGESAVMRVDLKKREIVRLRVGRGMPAISPSGAALLSVGFEPNERYLEMADGAEGARDPRRFAPMSEQRYFPAWNAAQTRVLFIKTGKVYVMDANGSKQHEFDPEDLDSKVWYTEKERPFTLQWRESGDTYKVYRSKPDGSGERMIYEAKARSISAPQWSPDSSRVAFVVEGVTGSSVLTLGADGSWPRHFFTTVDRIHDLAWSPDSLRLAWICDREAEGSSEVWTAGIQGLDPVLGHVSHGALSSLSWSPRASTSPSKRPAPGACWACGW